MLSIAETIQAPPQVLGPVGFAGLQVIFVTLTGQGVTHLSSIGLSRSEIAITLLSGPVCGAVLQPCFGRWSDQIQTPWGRRKPFIVVGVVVLIFGLISLAWVESIAKIPLPSTTTFNQHRLLLLTIAFAFNFTIWVAIQAVQVGLRTLITDGRSQDEQSKANAWASRYSNFAAVIANILVYVDFLPHASETTFKNMALLASLVLAITVAISCASVRENRPVEGNMSACRALLSISPGHTTLIDSPAKRKVKKHTTAGIRLWSPTKLLTGRRVA